MLTRDPGSGEHEAYCGQGTCKECLLCAKKAVGYKVDDTKNLVLLSVRDGGWEAVREKLRDVVGVGEAGS